MGIATRSVKPNGSTAWVAPDTITAAAANGDIDNILTQLNGNIDNSNVKSSAAIDAYNSGNEKIINIQNSCIAAAGTADIAPGKLDQTAGARDGSAGLGTEVVQAYAETAAEYNTQTSPGDSDAPSYPEHLKEELERIRYTIQRATLGIGCKLVDATAAATWFDGCAIGENVLQNGSFLCHATYFDAGGPTWTPPFGWTMVGTPTTWEPVALPAAEGLGEYVHFADDAGTGGAANEGFTQTLTGLKGGTLYLVEARVLPTTDVIKLTTTDAAAGTFTNLALSSGSGTAAWETLSGIILTDATPAVTINLLSDAATYDLGVAYVSVREVASTANTHTNEHQGTSTRGGQMVRFVQDLTSVAYADIRTATAVSLVVPSDGYMIEVTGGVRHAANLFGVAMIEEDVDAGGYSNVARADGAANGANTVSVGYVQPAPVPGSVYSYRMFGSSAGIPEVDAANKAGHWISAKLIKT